MIEHRIDSDDWKILLLWKMTYNSEVLDDTLLHCEDEKEKMGNFFNVMRIFEVSSGLKINTE